MTTIVAVRKGDRACLAADTLACYGSTRESAEFIAEPEKIVRVGDALLGPTGPAAAQLVLRSYFSDPERPAAFGSALEVFETLRQLQATLKADYFLNPKEAEDDSYESMQMELMIASPGGIFGAYPLRSVQEYTRFYAFGSGAEIALGALQVLYDQHDSAAEIARRAVEVAATFDNGTALPVSVHEVVLART